MTAPHPHRSTLTRLAGKVKDLAESSAPAQDVVDQVIDHVADALKRIFGG